MTKKRLSTSRLPDYQPDKSSQQFFLGVLLQFRTYLSRAEIPSHALAYLQHLKDVELLFEHGQVPHAPSLEDGPRGALSRGLPIRDDVPHSC